MSTPIDELIAEVKSRIDTLAVDGGYILAPSNHVMNVEPEKIIRMYETAREYSS